MNRRRTFALAAVGAATFGVVGVTGVSYADSNASAIEPTGPACESLPTDGEGSLEGMADDPAATAASNNPELSTTVAAVDAAGLVDTLNGEGPFTIFAPVNSAFDKIPADVLDALLADPSGALTDILGLHVVVGEQYSSVDLAGLSEVETLSGTVSLTTRDDGAVLLGAGAGPAVIVCADIPTANATVFLIDTVITTPPTEPSGDACAAVPADGEGSFAGMADDPAATAASNNPELSTLVAAVDAAGLVDTLNGDGPFTIFAPANSAFEKIPADTMESVMGDPSGALTDILTLHVVAGERLSSLYLAGAGEVDSLGGTLTFATADDGSLTVDAGGGAATIVCSDVTTANATVHIIDTVLMAGSGEAMDDTMTSEAMTSEMMDDTMTSEAMDDTMTSEMMDDTMTSEAMTSEG